MNSANPNGGLLVGFADMPGIAESTWQEGGVTLGNPTPTTCIHRHLLMEYDGYADFPHYWINPLATINAIMGMAIQHIGLPGLDSRAGRGADAAGVEPGQPDQLLRDRE